MIFKNFNWSIMSDFLHNLLNEFETKNFSVDYHIPSNESMTKLFIEREHSWANVEEICIQGLKEYPNNRYFLSFYGEALMNLFKNKEGITIIRRLQKELEKDLENSDNLYLYARNSDLLGTDNSFLYHKKSAEKGNMYGLNDLGYDYEKGCGTSIDKKKAFECYSKAAEMGNVYAQCNLGICYEFSTGTLKDFKMAFKYYELASNQGYQKGHCNLGVCYWNGTGVEKDLLKSTELFEKSKDLGFNLGKKNYEFVVKNFEFYKLGLKFLKEENYENSFKVFSRIDTKEAKDIVEYIKTIRIKIFILLKKSKLEDIHFHFY